MDPLLIYVALVGTWTVFLDIILISYYRRFWVTIKNMGLDSASSATRRTDELMKGGKSWQKHK